MRNGLLLLVFSIGLFFPALCFSAGLKNGMGADVVIGQRDFNSSTTDTTDRKFIYPTFMFSDGRRLGVCDYFNNRVLIWNSIPTTDFAKADIVLGQPDFGTSTSGATRTQFNHPIGINFDGRKLAIVDTQNNRVLIYNKIPETSSAPADVVIGQSSFTASAAGSGTSGMTLPIGACFVKNKFFVCDSSNNRVLGYNSVPSQNGAAADFVLGQPDFSTTSSGTSRQSMNSPWGIATDGQRLFVTDNQNFRVLIWNQIPDKSSQPADVVIGQPTFESASSGVSASKISDPTGIDTDGRRLFVVDQSNHRVLIWNSIPQSNYAPADFVLGQNDFVSKNARLGRSGMNNPYGVCLNGQRLFVSEGFAGNNRITLFNITLENAIKLGPQFEQGKAVVGKVFEDINGDGIQEAGERGLEGVKVVSDTGIYAITDEDGKYHFPSLEVGERLLKVDPATLPEGAVMTTDSPYHVTVTKGILTKVSFGVQLPGEAMESAPGVEGKSPFLKVSITQDPVVLKRRLEVSARREREKAVFTIGCNYFLFIEHAELSLYDQEYKLLQMFELPQPLPSEYEVGLSEMAVPGPVHYQLSVFDKAGKEDRTGMGTLGAG